MPSAEIQIVRTAVSLSPYGTAPMKTVPVFGGSLLRSPWLNLPLTAV